MPIRLRLTLVFALAMATVLAGLGMLVYVRVEHALTEAIDEGLEARARDLLPQLSSVGLPLMLGGGEQGEADEGVVQMLTSDGEVVAATGGLPAAPLLTPGALARAQHGEVVMQRHDTSGHEGSWRLLALPAVAEDQRLILVVGALLEERDEALQQLRWQLAIAGPLGVLLASLVGYVLATAAFRPVESMRQQAQSISGSRLQERLPVPPAHDEIARLAHTLNEMLARLEAALTREREFVADASHELRTPLALLKAELDLALRRPRSAEELKAALSSAAAETDRLVQLAEDLLLLARMDEGTVPVAPQAVDTRALLESVAQRFSAQAANQGRTITLDVHAPTTFHADRLRLEQALANMVDNALRYGRGTVGLAALAGDDAIELHVTDQGPGFPPDFLPQAFQRFTRAEQARGRGGTGLGLSIMEAIVRAHGGTAEAANKKGGGADVWISLPIR
ncbi:MAG: ATP-binding protein [Actinomycetota bacterium]|nr:ATP-binding protein [Actinomycetota bacterium]